MRSLSVWLALASIPAVALAGPIDIDAQSSIHPRDSDYSAEALNQEFLGIHWDVAKETCSDDQLKTIVRATRKANEMTALAFDGPPAETAAWHRYFVRDGYGSLKDTWSNNIELWANIIRAYYLCQRWQQRLTCLVKRKLPASPGFPHGRQAEQ